MPSQVNSSRQRLLKAAFDLFISQGITKTTTKQIAELAQVNEVTLFRHFGSKHGLFLALIEETVLLNQLEDTLTRQVNPHSSFKQVIEDYTLSALELLERAPDLISSLIGEVREYPSEHRQTIGHLFSQVNRGVAECLERAIARENLQVKISSTKLVSLLNSILLGYTVIELTSEFHQLWPNREDFLESLVIVILEGTVSSLPELTTDADYPLKSLEVEKEIVRDLPAILVHKILQKAKKLGLQDYALVYLLFATGLSPEELSSLERSHVITDTQGQLLQIPRGNRRQVPINQWVLGKRYGSARNNPLTQWLKGRKENKPALFINREGCPLSATDLRQRWQESVEGLLTPEGQIPIIEQAQQTWCVEMLIKGISVENLSILTGWDWHQLKPYVDRAKAKAALKQALELDSGRP